MRLLKHIVRMPLKFALSYARKLMKYRRRRYAQKVYNDWAQAEVHRCYVKEDTLFAPKISIVVPVYNTPVYHLFSMVYSVVNQHYQNWELVLVDASTNEESHDLVSSCPQIDKRIVVLRKQNEGISDNTNAGINIATGEYVAFVDHDDLLHACALHCIVEKLQAKKRPGVVYTDEDKVSDDGEMRLDPHCKPDWSPETLRTVNYINHLTIVEKKYIQGVGGLRSQYDGAQDYDLLLRIIDKYSPVIAHVPRILYHWRLAISSTATNFQVKPNILRAGEAVLNEHLKRQNLKASALAMKNMPGFYKISYGTLPRSVSVVAINIDPYNYDVAITTLVTIGQQIKAAGLDKQLIVSSRLTNYRHLLSGWDDIFYVEDELNIRKIKGDMVLIVNDAIRIERNDDIRDLFTVAHQSHVSAVAPIVVNRDRRIVDAGLVKQRQNLGALYKHLTHGEPTYFGSTLWPRHIDAHSASFMAIKKEVLERYSGLLSSLASERVSAAARIASEHNSLILWPHTEVIFTGHLADDTTEGNYNSSLAEPVADISMYFSKDRTTKTW